MMENYLQLRCVAVDMANIDLLTAIWKESSFFTAERKDEVRGYLTASLPKIAAKHDLSAEGHSFESFVREVYDKKQLDLIFDELSKKQETHIAEYLRAGGCLRVEAFAEKFEYLLNRRSYLLTNGFAVNCPSLIYWLLKRGKDRVSVGTCIYTFFKCYTLANVGEFLDSFLEVVAEEEDYSILDDLLCIISVNDCSQVDRSDFYYSLQRKNLLFPYWNHYVEVNLERKQGKTFNEFYSLIGTDSIPDEETLRFLAIAVTHPKCSAETKVQLAKELFDLSSCFSLYNYEYPLLVEFPYDYTFHHSLIHYLLKRVSRRRNEYKSTVSALIAKFGYNEDYDHFAVKKARCKAKLSGILQSNVVFVDSEPSSDDSSYSYVSAGTDEEEYESDTASEDSD